MEDQDTFNTSDPQTGIQDDSVEQDLLIPKDEPQDLHNHFLSDGPNLNVVETQDGLSGHNPDNVAVTIDLTFDSSDSDSDSESETLSVSEASIDGESDESSSEESTEKSVARRRLLFITMILIHVSVMTTSQGKGSTYLLITRPPLIPNLERRRGAERLLPTRKVRRPERDLADQNNYNQERLTQYRAKENEASRIEHRSL